MCGIIIPINTQFLKIPRRCHAVSVCENSFAVSSLLYSCVSTYPSVLRCWTTWGYRGCVRQARQRQCVRFWTRGVWWTAALPVMGTLSCMEHKLSTETSTWTQRSWCINANNSLAFCMIRFITGGLVKLSEWLPESTCFPAHDYPNSYKTHTVSTVSEYQWDTDSNHMHLNTEYAGLYIYIYIKTCVLSKRPDNVWGCSWVHSLHYDVTGSHIRSCVCVCMCVCLRVVPVISLKVPSYPENDLMMISLSLSDPPIRTLR